LTFEICYDQVKTFWNRSDHVTFSYHHRGHFYFYQNLADAASMHYHDHLRRQSYLDDLLDAIVYDHYHEIRD